MTAAEDIQAIEAELPRIRAEIGAVRERLVAVETGQVNHEGANTQRHTAEMAGIARLEQLVGRFGFAMLGVVVLGMMINGALVGVAAGVDLPGVGRVTVGDASAATPTATVLGESIDAGTTLP